MDIEKGLTYYPCAFVSMGCNMEVEIISCFRCIGYSRPQYKMYTNYSFVQEKNTRNENIISHAYDMHENDQFE